MTYHGNRKVGILTGADATIDAATQTYHPCKIHDENEVSPKIEHNIFRVNTQASYNPNLLLQGPFGAEVDIGGSFRDCVQIYRLLGDCSITDNDPNFTHEITTKVTRPNQPQTVYVDITGGTSAFTYRFKNAMVYRITLTLTALMPVTVNHSFGLGEMVSNTALTTYPVLYPTTDDTPYVVDGNSEIKWNSNDVGGFLGAIIAIERPLKAIRYQQTTGERYPVYDDAQPLKVTGSLIHRPDSANDKAMFDDSIAGTTRTLHFKVYKGANNHATFSFANTIMSAATLHQPVIEGEVLGIMGYGFYCTVPTITERSQVAKSFYGG